VAARGKNRQFPTAFKLKVIKRAEEGEGVLPVARNLEISRKLLHDWIKAWKAHGTEGLNRKPLQADDKKHSALAQASLRIAELERLVGRQPMDIDFFSKSLARLGAAGSARQTRIRIVEVIEAMTLETAGSRRAAHAASCSRRRLAVTRSAVPKPSVNRA
jgi:transposase-like protein